MPVYAEIYFIILFILFVPISILALISAVRRGRDSGLNGLLSLFLFALVPTIAFILEQKFKIDFFYIAFLFIVYLLLMPSTSKELSIVGKVEHIFTAGFIVLVFLFFLGLFVAPKSPCVGEKAKVDLTCVNMKGVANALNMFKLDNGVYPTTDEGFKALQVNPNVDKYINYAPTAYLEKLPKDSWAGKMLYVKTKDGFEIISYGADRREGGEDEYADIFYSECE